MVFNFAEKVKTTLIEPYDIVHLSHMSLLYYLTECLPHLEVNGQFTLASGSLACSYRIQKYFNL